MVGRHLGAIDVSRRQSAAVTGAACSAAVHLYRRIVPPAELPEPPHPPSPKGHRRQQAPPQRDAPHFSSWRSPFRACPPPPGRAPDNCWGRLEPTFRWGRFWRLTMPATVYPMACGTGQQRGINKRARTVGQDGDHGLRPGQPSSADCTGQPLQRKSPRRSAASQGPAPRGGGSERRRHHKGPGREGEHARHGGLRTTRHAKPR